MGEYLVARHLPLSMGVPKILSDEHVSLLPHRGNHSSRVEISPGSMPSSRAFKTRRMILPLRVFGSRSTYSISAGTAMGPRLFLT